MIVLLAIQLTGLNCLSDYTVAYQESQLQAVPQEHVNASTLFDADSCPCHLTFHNMSLPLMTLASVFTAMPVEASPHLVSTFIQALLRPPVFA